MTEYRLTRLTPNRDQLIFDYLTIDRDGLAEYCLEQMSCESLLFEAELVFLAHAPLEMNTGYLTELLSLSPYSAEISSSIWRRSAGFSLTQ